MRRLSQYTSGIVVHLVFALLLVFFVTDSVGPPTVVKSRTALVWTSSVTVDPRGSAGSGGDRIKSSPARIEIRPRPVEAFTLPTSPEPVAALELPVAVAVLSAESSRGIGTDVGLDNGRGDNAGPGSGPGGRPGPGSGDGPFDDGGPGVTSPQVLFEKKPEYTADATRARVQGTVLIEAVVRQDGTVTGVRIVRSLDPQFGLDQKAIDAVREWRFRPGSRFGKPVSVRIFIELTFTLR